jgi:uncharacterized protein
VTEAALPEFLADIVGHLRRRRVEVGVGEVRDLRNALRAGFGLSSVQELCELCVSLWATSADEQALVRAAFASVDRIPDWTLGEAADGEAGTQGAAGKGWRQGGAGVGAGKGDSKWGSTEPISPEGSGPGPLWTEAREDGLVLVTQYPLAAREVAQAWRHLRRPLRLGPATELDVGATIAERARRGVAAPPVVVPRRRNTVRLLLLLDRNGSMSPFHGYVDYVVAAIRGAGRVDDVRAVYFHDVPGSRASRSLLEKAQFGGDIDHLLGQIGALRGGRVYADPRLTVPTALDDMLALVSPAAAVLVISDAGAARGELDIARLVDTVALLKAARAGGAASGVAWLNPVPPGRWAGTTAEAIARHVPMYPFTRRGLDQAVDALRGRPVLVERPL